MTTDEIKNIVSLVNSKLEILKLKSDDYTWQCNIDKETKAQLNSTLSLIDNLLFEIRTNKKIEP